MSRPCGLEPARTHPRRAGRRGTVLLTALFIALFLFFLSVAMIVTNRGDIMLALGTDRHFRAQLAARAGTEVALQTMRQYSDWQARLQNAQGTLEDATWQVTVTPWKDGDDTGYFWDIEGTGVAGSIAEKAHMIVEEVALGRGLADGSGPFLFAYTSDKRLAVMDGTLRWTILGVPPNPAATDWLAARNGPLFTYSPDGADASPAPTMQEWVFTPVNVPQGGGQYENHSSQQAIPAPPSSRHLATLQKKAQILTWAQVPDPGPSLGKATQGTVDDVANGEPHVTTVTATNGTFTFSDSEFKGPVLEWYTLTGTALVADGQAVIAHAWHHLYQGEKVKNKVEIVTGPTGKPIAQFTVEKTPSRNLKKPAILRYTMTSGTWDRVMDLMQVDDPHSEPTVYDFPAPDTGALGLAGSTFYTISGNSVMRIGLHSLDPYRERSPVSKGLYDVGGQLALHQVRSALPTGLLTCTLGDLDPQANLSLSLAPVRAAVLVDDQWQDALACPQVRLDTTALGDLSDPSSFTQAPLGANCAACVGADLVTFIRVRRTSLVDAAEKAPLVSALSVPKQLDALALAVHDGTRWQIMPGGLHHFANQMVSTVTNGVIVKDASGTQFTLAPTNLAAAVYGDVTTKPLRRYAIVTRY